MDLLLTLKVVSHDLQSLKMNEFMQIKSRVDRSTRFFEDGAEKEKMTALKFLVIDAEGEKKLQLENCD